MTTPRFAIAIPMLNEAETVPHLLGGCVSAADPFGPFEICVTDDGSTDGTAQALRDFGAAHPQANLTIVTHPRPAGQSAAVHAAVRAARAPIVATLDGDGQNPPEELPKLLTALLDGPDTLGLVAGQRVKRDDPWHKRAASRAANGIRGITRIGPERLRRFQKIAAHNPRPKTHSATYGIRDVMPLN